MSFENIWEEEGIRMVFSGELTDEDLLESNAEVYSDKRSSFIKYELCDFTAVTGFPVNSDTIKKVAHSDKILSEKNPNMKVMVVSNDLVMKGLVNMYRVYGDNNWETEIFVSEIDARNWADQAI